MNRCTKVVQTIVGIAILASTAACQHSTNVAQYLPLSTLETSQDVHRTSKNVKIVSSCPKIVNIGFGHTRICTFREAEYSGKFGIVENPHYDDIFIVSPNRGRQNTRFLIQTFYPGDGNYVVRDKNGNQIIRSVHVLARS